MNVKIVQMPQNIFNNKEFIFSRNEKTKTEKE